ncbi:hypothetical protein KUCAC02_014114 [Chaenocephalus aceratus]|uniref:Uncharacterized protein n=1 Tax=Chaenocephalus aceratus TaxID=36190 RepID=A0ACB9WDT8_CHAAC|nr:hypothetical protein KUCAC02_014114 [Chaenocephalus aceratus]
MAVSKLVKYLLFNFNLWFFVGGIGILSFSALVRINNAAFQITDELLPAVNLMIFVGAMTMAFGFLGCCGVLQESRCLLAILFKGLLVMFLMLLSVGVLGAISRTASAQEMLKEHMKDLLPLSEQPQDFQVSFQIVEGTGFCCGFFGGHHDWGNAKAVPPSCNCRDFTRNCTVMEERIIYATPCMTYYMTWLDRVSVTLMGIASGFGILMILGMIFSSILFCQLRDGKKSFFLSF